MFKNDLIVKKYTLFKVEMVNMVNNITTDSNNSYGNMINIKLNVSSMPTNNIRPVYNSEFFFNHKDPNGTVSFYSEGELLDALQFSNNKHTFYGNSFVILPSVEWLTNIKEIRRLKVKNIFNNS